MNYTTKIVNNLSSRDFLKMYTLSYMMKEKSAYGREIIKHIRSKSSAWKPSHGSLYPLLNEMVETNMIYVYDIDEETKIKTYKLTAKGANYYNDRVIEFKNTLKKTSEFFDSIADELTICDLDCNENDNSNDSKDNVE